MNRSILLRPLSAGTISFTAATAMTSAAAIAGCAGAPTLVALSGLVGPPSITATESSTDQALELIRKRREEASGSCPAGFTRSGGNCVPTGGAAQVAQASAAPAPAPAAQQQATVTTTTTTGPAPAAAQAKRPATPRPASAAPKQQQVAMASQAAPSGQGYSGGGSLKDGGYDVAMPGTIRARGAWLEGYVDHEKHDNLNPGQQANPTRRTTSAGALAGVDISEYSTGGMPKGFQVGLFSGMNSTRARFTDTSITTTGTDGSSTQINQTLNARQNMEGAFAGLYGSAVHGAFSADLAFKVDFFNLDQTLTNREIFKQNCNNPEPTTITDTFVQNSTSMTNYVIASNMNYRFALSNNHYFEPTVGLRYTVTDFGGNAAILGVRDGEAFRVQGGLRFGMRHTTPDGWIWQTSLTGLLYSDVSISGFVVNNGLGLFPATALVDEGKLRAMGVLETRVDVGYGYTLYGDVEVRGGEDVFGVGSRLGVRYQW